MLILLNFKWINFSSYFDLLLHTIYALLKEEYPLIIHSSRLLSNLSSMLKVIVLIAKNLKMCNIRGLTIVRLKRNLIRLGYQYILLITWQVC